MTILEIVSSKIANCAIFEINKILAIEEVEQAIKNYCNISEVPAELNYTWANMATDLIRYNYESTTEAEDALKNDSSDVSSIKVGDTQVQLGGGAGSRAKILSSHKLDLDEIIMNYREQLNKFRKVVW